MSPSDIPMPHAAPAGATANAAIEAPGEADWVAARDNAAFCPLTGLGSLMIDGADAQAFLQGQLSSDLRRLAAGEWQRSTYNSPKGRMLASLILVREAGGAYRAVLAADIAEAIRKRLAMFVLRSKVTVTNASASDVTVGIAGSRAGAVVASLFGSAPDAQRVVTQQDVRVLALAPDRYLALGPAAAIDAIVPALAAGARRVPEVVWRWLQVRAGEPLITAATQDAVVLQAANLDVLGAVSFEKGCYTGQEIVARSHYLGRLKERMYAWHAEVTAVAPGTRVYSSAFGDQACGMVVNAAPAPGGGTDCLAVVQIAAVNAMDVHLDALDGPALQPLSLPYAIPEPTQPKRPKL